MEDYRDEIVNQINEVVDFELSTMTAQCEQYYLNNWDRYCDELDIDPDTSEKMYLWIVSRFDPEFETHNI